MDTEFSAVQKWWVEVLKLSAREFNEMTSPANAFKAGWIARDGQPVEQRDTIRLAAWDAASTEQRRQWLLEGAVIHEADRAAFVARADANAGGHQHGAGSASCPICED